MFSSITGFVKRHRRKFLITAGVVGGLYVAGRYLLSRIADEQEKEMAERLAHARMKHHFESNQRTCTTTCISLLPTLRERILTLLDTEEFTAKLKRGSVDKLEIWQQLKIVAFTRTVASVYAICFLVTLLRVQLNVMGRFMYLDSMEKQEAQDASRPQHPKSASGSNGDGSSSSSSSAAASSAAPIHIPPSVQRLYLSLIQFLLGEGLELLVSDVNRCVQSLLNEMSLKKNLTHSGLCGLIDHLRITLDQKIIHEGEAVKYLLPTLSLQNDFFQQSHLNSQLNSSSIGAGLQINAEELRALNVLVNETRQILGTPQYFSVLSAALDTGFETLSASLLSFFQSTLGAGGEAVPSSSLASLQPSGAGAKQDDTASPTITLPLAKIIPLVSAQTHVLFKVPQNELITRFSSMLILDQFSAVVYSAFDGNCEENLDNNMTFTTASADTSRIVS